EVRLWQDASIFTLVDRLIGSAHRRVMVEMYELGRAEVVQALAAATARGVDVRAITDPTAKHSRPASARPDSLPAPRPALPPAAPLPHAAPRVMADVYTLTHAEVIAGLVFAHRRGAVVRVVLDPNQSYNQRAFTLLRTGGVEVRWYPVPKGVLLHAKIGLFDGLLVLGSANWTLSGLGVNHELDVETTDAAVVQAYATRFESDWAKSA